MRIDSDFVKNCALGRWRDILLFLAPHLHQIINLDKHHGPCPLCGGKDRCRCFNDFENTGGIICNQCGGGANGLDVLMWANGWGFSEAFKAVVSYLGLTTNLLPIIRKHMPKQKEWYGKRKQLDKIWSESQADVERVRDYFEYRGLKRSFSGTLRFHPNLPYYHNDKTVTYHPAMLAQIICGVDVVGMHRTYLDSDGPGKAPVSSPKKTIKCADTMSGGSIRLFEPELGKPLVLCEGIETALAIHSYTDWPV
ncbi:MAG: hypothetical protein HOK41_07895, partial [Nitrospina sp.]|nr:hypothetical protein [Nitrospina sp.]